jgi:glycosyltransferase involved in cell wall biosynthesis
MRIVMLAPFGIRPKGTLLARMLPLAQALVQRGHTVSIAAPPVQNPEDADRREVYAGVPVAHTALPSWPGPLGEVQYISMLVRAVLAERPERIHLFKPKGYSGLAALVCRVLLPQVPLLVDTDDWEGWGGWNDLLPYPRPAKTLFAWQERDLPRRAAAVTVASRTLEAQVWGFGVAPERVFYLPNGLADTSQPAYDRRAARQALRLGDGPLLLLYTRFWEFDLPDIISALVAIVNRYPLARLLVIGRGERGEEHDMLRLAQRSGVAAAIDYRGWVEPPQIPALLAAADLALAPMNDTLINRARGLAKLLELMSAGLTVVAGRVGQAAEYIEDGRSGVLVPPHDPAALARAVLALLEDQAARAQLGQAARERVVQHYNWDRLALAAEAAYALHSTR